jgi:hypothetical protein
VITSGAPGRQQQQQQQQARLAAAHAVKALQARRYEPCPCQDSYKSPCTVQMVGDWQCKAHCFADKALLLAPHTPRASPGSFALSGMRSQLLPPSLVCSRMAGLPTIQPSSPLKLMDWNLRGGRQQQPSSRGCRAVRRVQHAGLMQGCRAIHRVLLVMQAGGARMQ